MAEFLEAAAAYAFMAQFRCMCVLSDGSERSHAIVGSLS